MGSSTSAIRWRKAATPRGVPTTLPPPGTPPEGQLALGLDLPGPGAGTGTAGAGPERHEVLPDVVLVRRWLDLDAQRRLVADFRRWAEPPAGLRHPRLPTGHLMTVQSVCLGWHWTPYAYSRTADDTDGAPVKPLPPSLHALARAAVAAAYGEGSPAAVAYDPDAVIANLYAPGAKLGLHQDGEEPSMAPVVTISLGDTGVFRMAGVDRRTGPFTDVELHSGDLLVFGGVNRLIFHGVPKVRAGTAPPGLDLPPGRLSITVRETGLPDPTD
ncbi:MAG TPA: alpha-ketoglutarate-dependent dioxygenase AlkB [Acidimicrobiales bacterium]